MRKFLTFFLFIILLSVFLFLLYVRFYPAKTATEKPAVFRAQDIAEVNPEPAKEEILTTPFAYGERFTYFYTMGPLRTGTSEITFVGETTIEGKEAYLVKFESIVGTFYDMENIYADKANFYPIYVERTIRNFGFQTNIKERYDQKNCKVDITSDGIFGAKTAVINKKNPIHNALLLIYYCRKISSSELKPGYEFEVVLPVDEFKVILTRAEKIRVPAGVYEAYLFESNPERMRLWIANDDKRTPLKMENMTAFGPSSIVLEK